MDVSIIIINYNTFGLTCDCITSVLEKTKDITYEIILVDNASSECDPELFLNHFPHIILIKNPVNTGFSKGNNTGIARASGNYIILLNSDTKLVNNAIKKTFDYLTQYPRAAVVSAKVMFPDGRPQSVCQRFPSVKYQLIELFRIHKLFSKKKAGKLLLGPFFRYDENIIADWIWGTYFMFKKNMLAKLPEKKLDDSLFMYGEDMQWCWDVKKAGYEAHYCCDAEIIHYLGSSNGKADEMIRKNHAIFMKRNYNLLHRWIIIILGTTIKLAS